MYHEVVKLFSQVCGVYGVVVLAILGFVFVDKKIFQYCVYLLMITMIYNTILKNIFQLPLPETCPHPGFGFPSGHSHFAAIFYLWIMTHYKSNALRLGCLIMITLTWYTIVYLGYHYAFDVYFAGVFAVVSITLFRHFVESSDDFQKISLFSIIISLLFAAESKIILEPKTEMIKVAVLLVLYTILTWAYVFKRDRLEKTARTITDMVCGLLVTAALLFRSPILQLKPHVYVSLYFIIGLYLGSVLFDKGEKIKSGNQGKILSVVIILSFFYIFNCLFNLVNPEYQYLKQLQWLLVAISMHLSIKITNAVIRR